MQIEEKQDCDKWTEHNTAQSGGSRTQKLFSEVRDITYRETYFLARYPEETDFHSGRSRGDDFRHSRAQGRIFDRSVSERADDWLCHGFKRGKSHQIPA